MQKKYWISALLDPHARGNFFLYREEYTSEESEGEESAQEDDRVQDEVVHEDDGCDEEGTCALEARLWNGEILCIFIVLSKLK